MYTHTHTRRPDTRRRRRGSSFHSFILHLSLSPSARPAARFHGWADATQPLAAPRITHVRRPASRRESIELEIHRAPGRARVWLSDGRAGLRRMPLWTREHVYVFTLLYRNFHLPPSSSLILFLSLYKVFLYSHLFLLHFLHSYLIFLSGYARCSLFKYFSETIGFSISRSQFQCRFFVELCPVVPNVFVKLAEFH